MTSIVQSRPPETGEDHSYRLDPPPGPECIVEWQINRETAVRGDTKGGLKVEGIGSPAHLSVEVVGDVKGTEIRAIVTCEGQAPDTLKFRLDAALPRQDPDLLEDILSPTAEPPVEHGFNLDAVTIRLWPWPYWRRLFGFCPGDDEKKKCEGTGIFFDVDLGPPPTAHLWPFRYTVVCVCEGQTFRWDLSFGVVRKGPY